MIILDNNDATGYVESFLENNIARRSTHFFRQTSTISLCPHVGIQKYFSHIVRAREEHAEAPLEINVISPGDVLLEEAGVEGGWRG